MTAYNDITGDKITSVRIKESAEAAQNYADNYERIFGKFTVSPIDPKVLHAHNIEAEVKEA